MNYYEKHIGDYIRDTVSLTMIEDGAYCRLLDQVYQTERALPKDKKEVYRAARAISVIERKAVDYVLEKFFHLTDDGFMQKRAQAVIEEFWDRAPANESKKENAKIRQQRARDRRKMLFDRLRELGVTPEFNASMRTLEQELSRVTPRDESQFSNTTVTRDDTLTQTPDTRHQYPVLKTSDDDSTGSGSASSDVEIDLPPSAGAPLPMREAPPLSENPAVVLSVALRRMGVNALFTHPAVQEWATKGVTLEILTQAVAVARESKGTVKIPPGYLVPIVNDLLNPPAGAPARPNAPQAKPRIPTGTDPKGLDESYDAYNARITKAEADRRKGQP